MRAGALWALMGALVLIAVSSYFRQFLGLSYELWRLVHGLLALFILTAALGHTLMVDHHLAPMWKQAVLVILVGVAIYLLIHSRLVRPLCNRWRPWKLISVEPERGSTWTLTFEPIDHPGLDFEPGQYAWFSLGDSPWDYSNTPFPWRVPQVHAGCVSAPTRPEISPSHSSIASREPLPGSRGRTVPLCRIPIPTLICSWSPAASASRR
jgi:predicted ferric reductase